MILLLKKNDFERRFVQSLIDKPSQQSTIVKRREGDLNSVFGPLFYSEIITTTLIKIRNLACNFLHI